VHNVSQSKDSSAYSLSVLFIEDGASICTACRLWSVQMTYFTYQLHEVDLALDLDIMQQLHQYHDLVS